VNKADDSGQNDADILECKADVLRLRNMKGQSAKGIPDAAEEVSSLLAAVVTANKKETPRTSQADIPRFDLAEEIMAEQRKTTAIKRKSPGKKIGLKPEESTYMGEAGAADYQTEQGAFAEPDSVISDIVARDIEKLYSGI